ncbi:hypothetical protein GCM10023328_46750 [Modestobacter marinus]|uniref:Uncharacterized protein n=1 Tax=Modestobacter marinus TaxID=477641 RepID=A0ABQ2GAC6_9ACTN|nr:hypothetical protein GCM10011589_44810 [Modestobacter marinus]
MHPTREWSDFTRPARVDPSAALAAPPKPSEETTPDEDPYGQRPTDYIGGEATLDETDSGVMSRGAGGPGADVSLPAGGSELGTQGCGWCPPRTAAPPPLAT